MVARPDTLPAMRIGMLCLPLVLACGTDTPTQPPIDNEPAFEVTSKPLTLQPNEERTVCFYFHTPNDEPIEVRKWVSDMTPGSHHMIYFNNLGSQPADGTIDDCDASNAIPLPMYASQIPHEELVFPLDDGAGQPLAQEVSAGTAGFLQMHYLNTTAEPLTVSVTIQAFAHPDNTKVTHTDLFATYNNDIVIPPMATNLTVSATCDAVTGRFWSMSTHSHKQATKTAVIDATTMVFDSEDWEHPGMKRFDAPTFFEFASREVTWECTYTNLGDNKDRTIRAGQSARTDEMCMATGYYFPATGPKGCFIDGGQCTCLL